MKQLLITRIEAAYLDGALEDVIDLSEEALKQLDDPKDIQEVEVQITCFTLLLDRLRVLYPLEGTASS